MHESGSEFESEFESKGEGESQCESKSERCDDSEHGGPKDGVDGEGKY